MSRVPPVCPRPLPLTMGTRRPISAARGASTREILSPTPPVLCLSATGLESCGQARILPLSRMPRVSSTVSSRERPRMNAAIRKAEAW